MNVEYIITKLQSWFMKDNVISVTNVDLKTIGKREIKLIEEVKKHDEEWYLNLSPKQEEWLVDILIYYKNFGSKMLLSENAVSFLKDIISGKYNVEER